jgi:hypothetical protein
MGFKEEADAAVDSGEVPGATIMRMAVKDGFADIEALKADPLWEQDFITDNWVRRTPEYFAARAIAEEALPAQREAAQIALGVALLELAKDLPPQEDGPRFAYVPNVGGYHEVCSFDLDGASLQSLALKTLWHRTSCEAVAEWRKRLLAYAATRSGDLLWWRERPEIEGRVPFGKTETAWRVYSRLLIGNVADTIIERIRRGEIPPRVEMIKDHVVTLEALVVVGYSYDAATNEWSRPGWRYDAHADRWREL